MQPEEIALALDGVREGRKWRCRCPSCGGGNLIVGTGKVVPVLVHCFNGCSWRDVFDALHEMQLSIDAMPDYARQRQPDIGTEGLRRRIYQACALYRSGHEARGTIVETYLQSRGITSPVPSVLRFIPYCPHRNSCCNPAMAAPVVNVDGDQIGIHLTFLRRDGSGKADFPDESMQRECRGSIRGGAVRLAPYDSDRELIVAEGIETGLA